jgi:excisionase family DNA binding protein
MASIASPVRYLTAREAAGYCRVSTKTVLRWLESGRLQAEKRGRAFRIALADLEPLRRLESGPIGDRVSSEDVESTVVERTGDLSTEDMGSVVALLGTLYGRLEQLEQAVIERTEAAALWQGRAQVLVAELEAARVELKALTAPASRPPWWRRLAWWATPRVPTDVL